MQLIVSSGNDYLVGVKGNQPKLLQQFRLAVEQQTACVSDIQSERTRDREVERIVKVYDPMCDLDPAWQQARSLVVMQRRGRRAGVAFEQVSYYLSSLPPNALGLGLGIRGHRLIENGLHWVKDVVLGEDAAPFSSPNAATNWSIIRSFNLNLLRRRGYHSITKALRLLRHDLDQLFHLVTMN